MSDPVLPFETNAEPEVPRTQPPRGAAAVLYEFGRKLIRSWQKPPEILALREAVEEFMETTPSAAGMPGAEQTLLTNILNLRDKDVGDCMVQRADIIAVDVEDPFADLVGVMAEHAHSRIPVYRDTLDEVLGMIHMKDVMQCIVQQRDCTVRDLLRPVLFVAPSMPAAKLLLQMRTTRQHMAMVVDEFGGIDGLVTIEDLVEQIVGEIEDEHDDPATPDVIVRADGSLLVDARLPIEEFEARLGTPVLEPNEREEIDTLGGYVFHLAGHVPKLGEIIHGPAGIEFEVLASDQNRIRRLRVRGVKRSEAAESAAPLKLAKSRIG